MTTPTVPASIRNRNPGSIYPGPSARRFGARGEQRLDSRDGRHRIATFPDNISGAAALFDNLCHARPDRARPYYYRGQTLGAAIETWCGEINAPAYLRVIEARSGLTPDVVLDLNFLRDPDRVVPLAKAMAWHEAGRPFPLALVGWQRAHEMALAYMPEPGPRPVPVAAPEIPAAAASGIPVHEATHAALPEAETPPELPAWTPDNDMPSPRPETRADAALAGSRKSVLLRLWQRLLVALGFGTGGMTLLDAVDATPSLVARIQSFAADNAALMLLAGVVIGLVLVTTVQMLQHQDAAEGRYQPRKEHP